MQSDQQQPPGEGVITQLGQFSLPNTAVPSNKIKSKPANRQYPAPQTKPRSLVNAVHHKAGKLSGNSPLGCQVSH